MKRKTKVESNLYSDYSDQNKMDETARNVCFGGESKDFAGLIRIIEALQTAQKQTQSDVDKHQRQFGELRTQVQQKRVEYEALLAQLSVVKANYEASAAQAKVLNNKLRSVVESVPSVYNEWFGKLKPIVPTPTPTPAPAPVNIQNRVSAIKTVTPTETKYKRIRNEEAQGLLDLASEKCEKLSTGEQTKKTKVDVEATTP